MTEANHEGLDPGRDRKSSLSKAVSPSLSEGIKAGSPSEIKRQIKESLRGRAPAYETAWRPHSVRFAKALWIQ